ncbi:hypothetical protein [Streptomyces sp. NPDC006195]
MKQWLPAYADLNWANMTGPRFCLVDWADWGMAPMAPGAVKTV